MSLTTVLHTFSQHCPNSPWAFVTALAAQVAADTFPAPALLHLKLGLILSLASQVRVSMLPVFPCVCLFVLVFCLSHIILYCSKIKYGQLFKLGIVSNMTLCLVLYLTFNSIQTYTTKLFLLLPL